MSFKKLEEHPAGEGSLVLNCAAIFLRMTVVGKSREFDLCELNKLANEPSKNYAVHLKVSAIQDRNVYETCNSVIHREFDLRIRILGSFEPAALLIR